MTARPRLTFFVWLLPAALAASAVAFWGRGVIEKEGVFFAQNYLSDRPLAAMILDPRTNDFGTFQARELSYLADYVNVRVLAWLFARGWLLLVPLTGVVGLVAAIAVFARGFRRWRLDAVTIALLLAWWLSTIVMQSSVAIFYRSTKMLLLVALLAFLFHACRLLDPRRLRPVTWVPLAGLFGLGLLMALLDRQGLYFVVLFVTVATAWYVVSPPAERPRWTIAVAVLAAAAGAAVTAELYNRAIAPWAIASLNGYRPDFSYQELALSENVGTRRFWDLGAAMTGQQARFFVSGVPLVAFAALVVAFYARQVAAGSRLRPIARDVVVAAGIVGGCVLLAALMVLRHSFVYTIPDHAYWYFFVPVQGLFAFGLGLLLVRLSREGPLRWRPALWIAIVAFVALNVASLRSHRAAMLASGYFAAEHEKSQVILYGHDRIAAGDDDPSGVTRWVSAGPEGAVLRLPVPRAQFFPDTLRLWQLAHEDRRPFDQLPGTQWYALREFLVADGSPLQYDDQIAPLLDAWRGVGIHEVRIRLDWYEDRAAGERTVSAIRAATGRVARESRQGMEMVFVLTPLPAPAHARTPGVRVAPTAMTITASHGVDRIPLLTDADVESRWLTGHPQQGGEWIRIAFDRPRDVARVRLDLTRRSYGDYARGLRLEAEAGGVIHPIYDGSLLTPLVAGLLRYPVPASAEIDLPANRSDAIVIRQTGAARVWYWSVHELAIWER
jgi:hypothetical protein